MSGEGPSQGSQNNYKLIDNKRGKTLLHAGYSYNVHRNNKFSTVWTCCAKQTDKCQGAVKLINQKDTVVIQTKHSPQCVPNIFKNEVKCVLQKTKEEICNNYDSVKKIYETNAINLKNKGNDAGIPSYENVKHQLYDHRKRDLKVSKTKFKYPIDVIIPEKFQKILLIDYIADTKLNDDRIIIFASQEVRNQIKDIEHYFCDGTFECCAKPFTQLYTVHGDVGSDTTKTNIIPIFYVLLTNKEGKTYETVWNKLKECLTDFHPKKFTLDFEVAAMNAIDKVFPQAANHGCFVHFQRCIFRKAKPLGLLEHEETKLYVKKCISLAYLPEEDIDDGWLSVMENSFPEENVTTFNNYFVTQWLEPPGMKSKWCCYKERHRTTNLVEAWNQRLQRYTGRGPSLLKLLQTIYIDIASYSTAQERLRVKQTPIANRRKQSLRNDNVIDMLTQEYEKKDIIINVFLEKISSLIRIKGKF